MTTPRELNFTRFDVGIDLVSREITGLEELNRTKGRYIYIISTPDEFSIQYKNGTSNICYIGRQSNRINGSRISAHAKGWISRFLILSQAKGNFSIYQCFPRKRGDSIAYRDIEAYLIREFFEKFGQIPLFNKRREREHSDDKIAFDRSIFRKRRIVGRIDARRDYGDAGDIEDKA